MEFEWDEQKNRINIQKHGISFNRASRIFDNPVLKKPDDRWDYDETRMIGIGHVDKFFIRVTYTKRGNRIRIINAKKASNREKRQYRRNASRLQTL